MEVGTSLSISIQNRLKQDETITYRSKVIDRTDEEIIIDYPVDESKYIQLPITTNSTIEIEYIAKGSVFKFTTSVLRLIEEPITAFVIEIPKEEAITKIQRREYVRINTDVNVAVHSRNDTFRPFITVTRDISGGGAAIIVPDDIHVPDGEILEAYLVLKSKYSDFEYIKSTAEAIRTMVYNGVRSTSLKFHFDDEKERQKVIKFCFEIQREKLQRQII